MHPWLSCLQQRRGGDLKEKMSIFNWFTSRRSTAKDSAPESSGLEQVDATVPLMPPARLREKPAKTPVPVSQAAHRKTERLEHREQLYSVVRDAMIRAGVLAASYKFKVLSLDAHGRQYLVMMELANQFAGDSSRLAEIEAMMARTAKSRHDILVTAVYWRVNEHVTAGLSPSPSLPLAHTPTRTHELPPFGQPATPVSLAKPASKYEPLHKEEVEAFKRALASATPAAPASSSGQSVTSGRRNPAPPVAFEDTQMDGSKERASPLSSTQYGDLN